MAPKKAAVASKDEEAPVLAAAVETETKVTKAPKPTKLKTLVHPSTLSMVVEVLKKNSERKGTSVQAIRTKILATHPTVDPVRLKFLLRAALNKGIEKGVLVRPPNSSATGATGRFKLAKPLPKAKDGSSGAVSENVDPNAQPKEKPKKKTETKAKKSTESKGEKPEKETAPKKAKSSEEKPKASKPKKEAEEKPKSSATTKKPKAKKEDGETKTKKGSAEKVETSKKEPAEKVETSKKEKGATKASKDSEENAAPTTTKTSKKGKK